MCLAERHLQTHNQGIGAALLAPIGASGGQDQVIQRGDHGMPLLVGAIVG